METKNELLGNAVELEMVINRDFWNNQYVTRNTGWDLGEISEPLKSYIDQLLNKNIRILIPGCGNSYEADYLLNNGFTDITVIDIAPELTQKLQERYKGNKKIKIITGDFFEHIGQYELILEQTFFCAINPLLRQQYAKKMNELLSQGGKLVGLFFNKEFEKQGPPFGGSKADYIPIFNPYFTFNVFESCHNSYLKRLNTELFFIFVKK